MPILTPPLAIQSPGEKPVPKEKTLGAMAKSISPLAVPYRFPTRLSFRSGSRLLYSTTNTPLHSRLNTSTNDASQQSPVVTPMHKTSPAALETTRSLSNEVGGLAPAASIDPFMPGEDLAPQEAPPGTLATGPPGGFPMLIPDPTLPLRSKTTLELLNSAFVYKMCTQAWLVKIAPHLISMASTLRLSWLVNFVTRHTFFAKFCAGETESEIVRTMRKLKGFGIGSILDVSIEADLSDENAKADPAELRARWNVKADVLAKEYERSIELASQEPGSFAALKVTGLTGPDVLYRLSQPHRPMHAAFASADSNKDGSINYSEFKKSVLPTMPGFDKVSSSSAIFSMIDADNDGLIDWLDIEMSLSVANDYARPLYMGKKGYGAQSESDFEDYDLLMARLNALADFAKSMNVRLMIDAEHSYFQPLIDNAALSLQTRFNKFDPSIPEYLQAPLVFNTYQMYAKNGLSNLKKDWERSQREGWAFGAKLVRGAYMHLERERASQMGYPSPINDTIEDTHAMYNAGVEFLLDKIASLQNDVLQPSPIAENTIQVQNPAVFVATHNANSIEKTIQKAKVFGIPAQSRTVMVGQLLGMHDDVSYTLGRDGYSIYKYVPYGPVGEVLPYLIRRAQENSAVLGTIQREVDNIKTELKHRIFGGARETRANNSTRSSSVSST
ncbi:proline dehydrogenase [Mycoemilia scoparia]|uniref:Proline dehydrogenase n=1 Tax=Mycoemilia scoparia TaxID=417184 RepID=A0A9W8A6W4_9FUNG|nr:proline dehydrogenase [Mycoemilia scoparia]